MSVEVKLTQAERNCIAARARKHLRGLGYDNGYGIDDAADFLETEIYTLGRFDDVPMTEISDYARSLARFICHAEARTCYG